MVNHSEFRYMLYVSEILHNELAACLSESWLLFGWKLNENKLFKLIEN